MTIKKSPPFPNPNSIPIQESHVWLLDVLEDLADYAKENDFMEIAAELTTSKDSICVLLGKRGHKK